MRPQVVLSGLLVLLLCACHQAQALMVMRKESAPMRWDRRWCLWGCRYISVTAPLPSATSASELAGEATPSVIETPESSVTFESTAVSPLATSATSVTETSAPVDAALSTSTDISSPSAVPSTTNVQSSSSSSPKLSLCIPYLAALSAVATAILYL